MSLYDYQVAARYVQYEGALDEIRRFTFGLGQRILVLTSCGPITSDVVERIKDSFSSSMESKLMPEMAKKNSRYGKQMAEAKRFDALNYPPAELFFKNTDGVDVSDSEIEKLCQYVRDNSIDVIIGAGGGRAMDLARGAAFYTNVTAVLVPTSAATNASATQLSIVHADDGSMKEHYLSMADYPALVLVDTGILIGNPADLIVAGVADQICSYKECKYDVRHQGNIGEFSELCWDVVNASEALLFKHAAAARKAAQNGVITPEFEMILSLVMHNSDIARSVSGSGISHTLGRALVTFPECRNNVLHGMQVGYGVIPMMIAEGEDDKTVLEYIEFCRSIGIPTSLSELHLDRVSEEELLDACNDVFDPSRVNVPFDGKTIVKAIRHAEELAR